MLTVGINEAQEIGVLYRDGVGKFIECGARLLIIKKSMIHGQWKDWLVANERALGFGVRTAQKLIKATLTAHLDWGNGNHRAIGTGDNEWHTPPQYLELARRVLGGIDLDPASTPLAQALVGAERFFTREDDGLSLDWSGKVWLNPPYTQPAIEQFVLRLCGEYKAGRVTEAVMLTHNYTDTRWFQSAAAVSPAICFTRGRIGFLSPGGEVAACTQGQAFFYFGKNVERFIEVFKEVGFICLTIT